MLNIKNPQAGFTLIEVVAAAALLGLMVTMAMPSLSAANAKVKNSRLKADLATVDQAIQLYVIDKGSVPASLDNLVPDYITKVSDIKDAADKDLEYSGSGTTYSLKGQNTKGDYVYSNGSSNIPAKDETSTENK